MAKHPPAFQYYPRDFESSTRHFTVEEVGVYIRLLNYQWINGPLPADHDRLRRMAGTSTDEWERCWPVVSEKFEEAEGGLVNERLEVARIKQQQYREDQAKRGKMGADARWQKDSKRHSKRHASANGETMALQSASASASASETATATADTESCADDGATKPKGRKRDYLWEALMEVCEVDTGQITKSARGAYNRALADLKKVEAMPEEVRRRAGIYRRQWPKVSLTPTSLARRWSECEQQHKPTNRSSVGTNEERRKQIAALD